MNMVIIIIIIIILILLLTKRSKNKLTLLKGHALTGLNNESIKGTTLDKCQEKLLSNPLYKSADYGKKNCYLSKNDRYSGPLRKDVNYDYIQKGNRPNLPL